MAIKIISKVSTFIEIELYEKTHKLSANIKAASAHCLLECDFEYISFVYNFLTEFQKEK